MRRKPVYVALCALLCLSTAEQALGTTTTITMAYDAGGNVVQVTDPRGLVTTYTYDGLGQLLQQVSPDTGTTGFGYDAYGRRTSMTRASGVTTTYGYDSLDRVVSVNAGGQTQSFSYDNCTNGTGRVCKASDSTGSTSYAYTPEGWLAGRSFNVAGTAYALNYAYDTMGRLSAVTYPDGNQANYSYADGVVSAVTLSMGGSGQAVASNVTYRPGNLAMAGWVSSNGLSNTLSYDTDGRLTGISASGVQSLSIAYDKADRIVAKANGIDPSQSENYNYDDQSRLIAAYGVANNESYGYDADGNRITQTVNGATATFGISATSNRLMSVSGAVSQTYDYDPQGNLQKVNGAVAFQYNPFNRLANASGANDYVSPEGQRLRKTSAAGTTYFAPEGASLLAERVNGAWIDYVWLNGRLIGRSSGSTVYAVHDDQTGRPQVVTDASSAVAWKANNYPFDRTVAVDSIGGLNVGFPGQYYDAERGTWNNGHRDYNASSGRYIESDPLGLASGINTYVYALNAPLSAIDPLGLATLCDALRQIATNSDKNPFLNGSPFNKNNLSQEDVPLGGGPRDTSNFRDSRNGLVYDVQYVQVGWSLTKTYGPGAGVDAATLYQATVGGIHPTFLLNGNFGENMRGAQLGQFGALHFDKFKDFVKDLCPCGDE